MPQKKNLMTDQIISDEKAAYIGKPFKTYFLPRPNLQDEKDNRIAELAVTSRSEFLITGNIRDFVQKAELRFEQLKIITPGGFVKMWRDKYV
ncbi:hypothetical protein QUF72_14185 [Desulfobacterales bacterium HSG2]|nr:hypothetical protein [Desulfobacterales bacterium HSG2]